MLPSGQGPAKQTKQIIVQKRDSCVPKVDKMNIIKEANNPLITYIQDFTHINLHQIIPLGKPLWDAPPDERLDDYSFLLAYHKRSGKIKDKTLGLDAAVSSILQR
jgi:hypothetical protein